MSKRQIVLSLLCNPSAIFTLLSRVNVLRGKQIPALDKLIGRMLNVIHSLLVPILQNPRHFFWCWYVACYYPLHVLNGKCFLPSYYYTSVGF